MKTAVIYARYSSDRQTEQSIEGQLRVCNEYATKNNITIVDNYIDRAMTGTNDHRPAFQAMLKDSHKAAWDYVIVYKLDRFSRDIYESAIHKRTLTLNGVKLVSAMENIPDSPEGIILESLLNGMNQYYSAELSQKVKRGLNETRRKGNFPGGYAPYGYKVVNKKVVVDEDEAQIVRYIFSEYARGRLAINIMRELNKQGILNKGKPFAKTTLHRILSNEKYIGIFRHNDEVLTNIYPPIVSNDIFEFVRVKVMKNQYGKHKEDVVYLLKDKLRCGYCGHPVHSSSGKSKSGTIIRYYRCSARTTKYGNKPCILSPIRKELMEEVVIDVIKDSLSKKLIDYVIDRIMKAHIERANDHSVLNILKQDLDSVQRSIDNLLIALENGISTKSTQERLASLDERKSLLQEKIICEETKSRLTLSKDDIKKFFLKALKKAPLQMIDMLVDHVLLYEDKIEIFLKYQENQTTAEASNNEQVYCTTKNFVIDQKKYGRIPESHTYEVKVNA